MSPAAVATVKVSLSDVAKRMLGVFGDVARERVAQDAKWGEQNHPDGTGPDSLPFAYTGMNLDLRNGAQVAHIFRAQVEAQALRRQLTWLDILLEELGEASAEDDPSALRAELVQVAAVAVAWVEALDRRTAQ